MAVNGAAIFFSRSKTSDRMQSSVFMSFRFIHVEYSKVRDNSDETRTDELVEGAAVISRSKQRMLTKIKYAQPHFLQYPYLKAMYAAVFE